MGCFDLNRNLLNNNHMERKNEFLSKTQKHDTVTENMAVAHSSTGDELADQFSKAGSYRGRNIMDVFADQSRLHAIDPEKALKFIFYLRLITRKTSVYNEKTETVQKGQGQRDESFKRFLWYANNKPEVFYRNAWLFIPTGRYKDILELLWYAHMAGINVDEAKVLSSMLGYARLDPNSDLLKKYLPLVDSSASTDRAKFMNHMSRMLRTMLGFETDEGLRDFKTSGEAHVWQQKISQQRFHDIEFNNIPGKALHNMVRSDFLKNHDLEQKYLEWIKEQPVAKFTGYVYELMKSVEPNMPIYKKYTYDKQFKGLIELASEDEGGIQGNVWTALDTSGSMSSTVTDGLQAIDVCLSLGIYFATLNEGAFHKNVIMFDSDSRVKQLEGEFTDMVTQLHKSRTAWGSTNFQSVVDEIVRIRQQNPDVPLEDYPQTLLVVSDMQFNPSSDGQSGGWGRVGTRSYQSAPDVETNHETQMRKLRQVFPDNWVDDFRVIWWDCTGRRPDNQPTHIDEGGTYVFSGWDGSIITLLLGGEEEVDELTGEKRKLSLQEMIDKALSQEIFSYIDMPK